MSDWILDVLTHYTINLSFNDVPEETILEVKKRLLDSVGVAIAAYRGEPVKIARKVALNFRNSTYSATIWGTQEKVSIDWAIFTNGLMVRYLDFNDTYLSKEPLHPSDMIAPILSVAEMINASGKDVIAAIALAYEIGIRFCDAGSLRTHGWDHVNYITIGSVLGMCKLLKLSEEDIKNALSIAIISHCAMRQSRVGELSHWKAAAAPNAARNAVFATLLAMNKFTGPEKPFVGEMAFLKQLLSNEFDEKPIKELENLPRPRRILDTIIKPYPVEIHSQTAVEAAKKIREKFFIKSSDEIDEVVIDTFKVGYEIIVKDPEKWNPRTRETADHSLIWVTATALLHGEVWLDHYTYEKIRDPNILSIIRKSKVRVDPEIDKMYPQAIPNRVTVKLRSGEVVSERVDYPKGHPRNPMSIQDVEVKFKRLVRQYMTEKQIEKTINTILHLEDLA
ncbi:MAG: propanediol utilization protein, partial [Thermoprotei archaeon ex4572_64]